MSEVAAATWSPLAVGRLLTCHSKQSSAVESLLHVTCKWSGCLHHHDEVQSCIESYSCATQTAAWEDKQGLEKLVYCEFHAVC